jgi:hypothetical protein
MADTLSKLLKPGGRRVVAKTRVGRGVGSGLGKTSGRGSEGPVRTHARLQAALRRRADAHPATSAQARLSQPVPDRHREVNVGDLEIFGAGASVDERARRARAGQGSIRPDQGPRRRRAHEGRDRDRARILQDGRPEDRESRRQGRDRRKSGGLAQAEIPMSALSAFANIGKVPELRSGFSSRSAARGLSNWRLRHDSGRGSER